MLRKLTALVLMVLVVPTAAAAGPLVSLKIGPAADDRGEPYYVWVNVTQPEAPHNAKPDDDCSAGQMAPSPEQLVPRIVDPIASWDPLAEPRLSGWFPRCIATEHQSPVGDNTRVSYDVTSGRYFVGHTNPLLGSAPGGRISLSSASSTSGTTGVSIVTDCEACPPPWE